MSPGIVHLPQSRPETRALSATPPTHPSYPLIPAKAGTQAGLDAGRRLLGRISPRRTRRTQRARCARRTIGKTVGDEPRAVRRAFVFLVSFVFPLQPLLAWVPAFAGMSGFAGGANLDRSGPRATPPATLRRSSRA